MIFIVITSDMIYVVGSAHNVVIIVEFVFVDIDIDVVVVYAYVIV